MEKPLSIGIICHPTFGGSGVVAAELGLALAERGHVIHLFSYLRPIRMPPDTPRVHFHEVEVTTYPLFKYPPYTLSLATKLAVTCRQTRIDILHAHYAIPHSICAYLCRQIIGDDAPKLVTTLHGTDINLLGLDESFFEITRFGLLQSDGVTAVSSHLAQQTCQDFRVDREVRVIHNFVDTERFSPRHRSDRVRADFAGDDEVLIGHLSNFREVKRVGKVIEIFRRIHRELPARLVLIGDGPDREPTLNLVGELGLQEHVVFLGTHREVPEILPQLDLFLLPSRYESFGLAALEAMACGVPVVASRVGGLPEVVLDGEGGFLCPPDDVDAFARRAIEILSDGELRARLTHGARRRAETLFTRDRIVDRYEEYYRDVLGP